MAKGDKFYFEDELYKNGTINEISVKEIKNLELKDDKNKPVVCDNDSTSMTIEVLSSTTIKTFPEGSADLQVANPDTEIKMSDDYVHTNKYVYYDPNTGKGSINRGFFVFADDDNNYTYSTFKDNIEFTISGPDNIEINVFGKKCCWDGKK